MGIDSTQLLYLGHDTHYGLALTRLRGTFPTLKSSDRRAMTHGSGFQSTFTYT